MHTTSSPRGPACGKGPRSSGRPRRAGPQPASPGQATPLGSRQRRPGPGPGPLPPPAASRMRSAATAASGWVRPGEPRAQPPLAGVRTRSDAGSFGRRGRRLGPRWARLAAQKLLQSRGIVPQRGRRHRPGAPEPGPLQPRPCPARRARPKPYLSADPAASAPPPAPLALHRPGRARRCGASPRSGQASGWARVPGGPGRGSEGSPPEGRGAGKAPRPSPCLCCPPRAPLFLAHLPSSGADSWGWTPPPAWAHLCPSLRNFRVGHPYFLHGSGPQSLGRLEMPDSSG